MEFEGLLNGCIDADPEALKAFVQKYNNLISSLVKQRIKVDWQDISQEVFIKIIERQLFSKFKGTTEKEFRVYLARIAVNYCYDILRKEKRRGVTVEFEDLTAPLYERYNHKEDPLFQTLEKETLSELQQAILQLPLKYRQTLELRLSGYDNTEIARIREESKSTIETRVSRAIEKLSQIMKKVR